MNHSSQKPAMARTIVPVNATAQRSGNPNGPNGLHAGMAAIAQQPDGRLSELQDDVSLHRSGLHGLAPVSSLAPERGRRQPRGTWLLRLCRPARAGLIVAAHAVHPGIGRSCPRAVTICIHDEAIDRSILAAPLRMSK